MASVQNQEFNFPYYPLPPPQQHHPSPQKSAPPPPPRVAPPPHSISPSPPLPPPHSSPPPVPIVKPPPPPPPHKSSPPPAIVPPPPHHPIHPPPPHIVPSPPPPAPPGHHSAVIIVVFVSLGGLLFLAFLALALICFIRKRKKKMAQETDIVNIDEHIKVQEAVIPGPNGPRVIVLSTEKDVHIQEEIKKNEEVTESSHVRSAAQNNHERLGGKSAATFEPSHYLLEH